MAWDGVPPRARIDSGWAEVVMDLDTFARAALACYFTFIAVFYTAKLIALRARTGRAHIAAGASGSAQRKGRDTFNAFRLAIWGVCVVRVPYPELDAWLGRLEPLYTAPVIATGLALLLVSQALTVYTHSYMADDWMSGTGDGGPRRLITGGPFGVMRHPLFVAIGVGQMGLFLALPSVFTLVSLVVGAAVIANQARIEDRALERRFGGEWRAYAARVPALAMPRPFRRGVSG